MKKIVRIGLFGLTAALLMAGCSKKEKEPATTAEQSSEAAATTTETTVEPGSIKLGEYKGIQVTMDPVEVTEEEIDDQAKSIVAANPDYAEVDRPSKEGDTVNIDYLGKKDGVAFDGGAAQAFDFVIGETNFIEGFQEGLIGVTKGEKKNLDLTFPDPYENNPDLAGKAVVFEITVNSVEEKHDATLNDAFVQRISDFQTIAEWRSDIKDGLTTQKENQVQLKKQNDILTAAIANATFEGIEASVEANYKEQVEQMTNAAAIYGMKFSDYAAMYGTDEEGYKAMIRTQAENAVKLDLLCEAVAKQEKITVEDSDRESLAIENGAANAAELIQNFGQEMVDKYAIQMKTVKFLEDNAVVK